MAFWTGLEGLTGHRPGAFSGFRVRDILDKDMWEMRERLNQGRRLEETGVPDTTAVYRDMGKPGAFGPVVGQPRQAPVQPQVAKRNFPTPGVYPPANATTRPYQFPNIQSQMLTDPRMSSGPGFTGETEKKTVRTEYDDPTKSNTTVQTVVEKGGTPSSIMNLVNQTYPHLDRTNQIGNAQVWPRLGGNVPGGSQGLLQRAMNWEGFSADAWKDLINKRYLEEMRKRQDHMRFRQNPIHLLQRR